MSKTKIGNVTLPRARRPFAAGYRSESNVRRPSPQTPVKKKKKKQEAEEEAEAEDEVSSTTNARTRGRA